MLDVLVNQSKVESKKSINGEFEGGDRNIRTKGGFEGFGEFF